MTHSIRCSTTQNEAATVQFLLDGKPFPFDLLEHNKLFVVAILSQEPGPIIDYAQLAICIRTLRDMASYTPNYKDLDIYLDNLLSVHTRWKQAAMLYHSYVTYTTMVSGLFITHSDPDPLSLVRNMPPPAQNLMSRVRQHHLLPKTQLHIQHELHLRKTYHSMHYAQLSALKTSTLLSQNLDRLSHALRLHDEYLAERHEERNEAITKLNNLTTRIASHMTSHHGIQQQFGQLGSVSMHPETLDAVLAVHHDITNEYFPSYIEEGFAKQCAEVEEQVDSGRFKAQHGFETWSDCQGRMRGVGCDEESGVWYGERYSSPLMCFWWRY